MESVVFFSHSTEIHFIDICFKMMNFLLLGIVPLLLLAFPIYLFSLWILSILYTFSHWIFSLFVLSLVRLLVIQLLFSHHQSTGRLWTLISYAYMKEIDLGKLFISVVGFILLCMKKGGFGIMLCLQYLWHGWCKIIQLFVPSDFVKVSNIYG